ncbi:plasmid maintenance system antidote protein VapI [Paraburkholderia sp. CI2]|uniref:helix-turn-helix domain-containing protein n=1 Tax=Paraburkholderia sp. CI2 TaxID=2723093 RepID=UPI0018380053|nr:helix-turn-helix domain-containing protein [Paraburkholderia sp. CI2]MBB5469202.1 plasmid maintenance system antidote protein VapI [Paraburkholderia sp. CI2]
MMNYTCDHYLDAAKTAQRLPSDYALAKMLGIRPSAISNYRMGRSNFDEETAIKVARLIGISPAEIFAAMQIQRAKSEEVRKVWEDVLEKISKGFRWLALPANACGVFSPQV